MARGARIVRTTGALRSGEPRQRADTYNPNAQEWAPCRQTRTNNADTWLHIGPAGYINNLPNTEETDNTCDADTAVALAFPPS